MHQRQKHDNCNHSFISYNKDLKNNVQGRMNYIRLLPFFLTAFEVHTLAAISTTRKNERMIRLLLVLKWYKSVVIIMLAVWYLHQPIISLNWKNDKWLTCWLDELLLILEDCLILADFLLLIRDFEAIDLVVCLLKWTLVIS